MKKRFFLYLCAVIAAVTSAWGQTIDLSTITTDYVIPNGAILTGKLQNIVKLTVADNATITLSGVDINWDGQWNAGDYPSDFAGITCNNATIILAACTTNKIRGFLNGNSAIHVKPNYTVTIQGTGTLYAATNGGAAAIGSGYGPQNSSARDGGNIIIKDGTIFATGGNLGSGIGAGGRAKVGNITIQGGIITATGGGSAAGIGCGQTKQSDWKAQCGNITITNGVKYLKATKGSGAAHSIGKGNNSSTAVCGTVTINGTTGAISTSPYTYSPAADNVKNLINAIGSVAYTQACKDKIDAARAAYDALADYTCDADAVNTIKALVTNYSTLTDAEAAYAALTPSADPTIFAGFTVTDGCGGFGGEDHTKLVDGKFTSGNEGVDWTKWCADSQHKSVPSGESEACWWVDFNAANPIAVTGYILTTGNDNIPHGAGRNPSSWIIKAKLNESDSWTTIATVSNDNTMQIVNFTDFAFTLDQAGTYKYFRFMVSAPVSGICMQLCELRFTGNGAPAPTPTINDILQELYDALGNDVWAGYGDATGVITYAQGTEPNSFKATFMGGAYAIEIPFGDFTQAEKVGNGDGSYTYNLDVNLPAQTGLSHEVLHVTVNSNGEITGIHSDVAQTDMNKVGGAIASWADLNAAMANGGVLQLSQSLTATNLDGALIVPAGKTVVLDLNGYTLNRNLGAAQANGCVIINNGTLAIMGEGEIKGGNNSDNGGGIVNNGTFTLYGGKITANHAAQGAGVYNSVANNGTVGFWMTGGLIDGNTASSYPAIKGDVTFSNLAVVQVNAGGTTVSTATAIAGLATYDYIRPVMPNMDKFAILAELHAALGNDVWAGYGEATGVITYAQGTEPNSFKATFMGGNYEIEIPFGDFTQATKTDNGDGTFTYDLVVTLPAQTGMSQETLHVTTNANGEILAMESENAGIELQKETDSAIATWNDLQNALNAGGIIKLTQNVENGDAPLVIPTGKTVVLNLNGHTINRGMTSAAENGSVIVNNGTLAVLDNSVSANGVITGGKTTGNGGGVLNNGTFTLYAGEIAGNEAAIGGGVYNTGGFWMTGGLIDNNTAGSYPAIGGDVTFNSKAAIQINSDETKVSIAMAKAGMETYSYIKPIMPDPENYYVVAATLTIPANSYATYFADKGLELALGTANGVVLTSVKAVNAIAGTLTLSNALESAAALTPLIIYNGTDEEQEVTLIVNENGAEVSYDKVHFFGTAAPQTFTAADMAAYDYYVLNGGQFVWVKDPGTLPANRCYLRLTKNVASGAPSFVINFGGDTTGIKEVKEVNNDSWHDLNGRKLQGVPTKKGVYINNGRKVVIR